MSVGEERVRMLLQLLAPLLASGGAAVPQSVAPPNAPGAPAQPMDPAVLAALLTAMQSGPPIKYPRSSAVLAGVVTVGFFAVLFALVALLIFGRGLISGGAPDVATILCFGFALSTLSTGFGVLASKFGTIIDFDFGDSYGSRQKDARGQDGQGSVVPIPVPTPQPAPTLPQPEPAPVPAGHVLTLRGKCSWFGGPDDHGSGDPNEGLALYTAEQAKARHDLFMSGSYGLLRGLNPDALYIACRWDYGQTTAAWLRKTQVKVSAKGKSIKAWPVDWGPNARTGRVADLSPGVLKALGIETDDEVVVEIPLPDGTAQGTAQPIIGGNGAHGADIVALARKHIGEKYRNVQVPKNDPNWRGPWDCAEFASWLVYQVAVIIYGCTNDSDPPAMADAYTGAWKADAHSKGRMVSVAEAAATSGAFLLRYPPAPGEMGHIAVSDGQGGTIEAAGTSTGVVAGKVSGRRWDTGVLVPGIDYSAGAAQSVQPPAKLYAIGQSNMDADKVKEIQTTLAAKSFGPGEIDGEYGQNTALAVVAFQQAQGLIPDGEVGPDTAAALGVTL